MGDMIRAIFIGRVKLLHRPYHLLECARHPCAHGPNYTKATRKHIFQSKEFRDPSVEVQKWSLIFPDNCLRKFYMTSPNSKRSVTYWALTQHAWANLLEKWFTTVAKRPFTRKNKRKRKAPSSSLHFLPGLFPYQPPSSPFIGYTRIHRGKNL